MDFSLPLLFLFVTYPSQITLICDVLYRGVALISQFHGRSDDCITFSISKRLLHFLYVLKFKLDIEHKICKKNNTKYIIEINDKIVEIYNTNKLVSLYNKELTHILDKHAPTITS